MNNFQGPPRQQQGSALLRLPAELRTKIWRMLFKSATPLWTLPEFTYHIWQKQEQPQTYGMTYDLIPMLSAQVLGACQQIYSEGTTILFEENVLCIFCNASCHILGARLPLPEEPSGLPFNDFDLLHLIGQIQFRSIPTISKCLQSYESLARIQQIRLTFDIEDENWYGRGVLAVSYRVLAQFLYDKDVTMRYYQLSTKSWIDVKDMIKDIDLRSCHILRCQSILFPGPETDATRSMKETITSLEPAPDTYADYRDFEEVIRQGFADDDYAIAEDAMNNLRDISLKYNDSSYQGEKQQVLEWLKSESEEVYNYEIGESTRRRDTRNKVLRALEATRERVWARSRMRINEERKSR